MHEGNWQNLIPQELQLSQYHISFISGQSEKRQKLTKIALLLTPHNPIHKNIAAIYNKQDFI